MPQQDDKKYDLYKVLETTGWNELPDNYADFSKLMNNRDYFDKARTMVISFYPDAEESKLDKNEFYHFFNSNDTLKEKENKPNPNVNPDPALITTAQWLSKFLPGIAKDIYNLSPQKIAYNDLTGNMGTIDATQNVAEFGFNLLTIANSIPGWMENTAVQLSNPKDMFPISIGMSDKQIAERQKLQEDFGKAGGVKDQIIIKNVKGYVDYRAKLRKDWSEAGIVKDEPTESGSFWGGLGFTIPIMVASMVPVVGPGIGLGLGMSGEAMDLAGDVYESTGGNIEATKYAWNLGNFLGISEIFTPLQAAQFAKKGITNMLKKDIANGFKKEAIGSYLKVLGKEAGKNFVGEGTQEWLQTLGEQGVKIHVGMQDRVNWDEVNQAGIIGGFTGLVMAGGSTSYNVLKESEKLQSYVRRELPKKLDDYVKYGLITPEEKDKALAQYKDLAGPELRVAIENAEPIEQTDKFVNNLKEINNRQKLAANLTTAFDNPGNADGLSKAMALADKAIKEGIPVNTLDAFLLNRIQSSNVKIPEFENIEAMNAYTNIILNSVEKEKDFLDVKAFIKKETGTTNEQELIRQTHEEILNGDKFAKLRNGYLNKFVGASHILPEIESFVNSKNAGDEAILSENETFNMAVISMSDDEFNKLESRIIRMGDKPLHATRKAAVQFAYDVKKFNIEALRRGVNKKYSYDPVMQGERQVYKINNLSRTTQVDPNQETFLQQGKPEELSPLKKELSKIAPQNLIDAIPNDTKLVEGIITDNKRIIASLLGLAGNFNIKENTIRIGKFYSTIFGKNKTLLHEAVHAATMTTFSEAMKENPLLTKEQIEAAKILNDIAYEYILNTTTMAKMSFPTLYGTMNQFEFIAEFVANSKFREFIGSNNITEEINVVSYLWAKILEMLGISKKSINNELISKIETNLNLLYEGSKTLLSGEIFPQQGKTTGSTENIKFQEEPTSGYRNRTIKNASADATIALAVDFNSAGERLTKESVLAQKKQYIPVNANSLEVTPERVKKIVDKLNAVNAKTLNIAGNGIYTIKGKYTQEQIDDFTYKLIKAVNESSDLKNKIESIRTGGQTGFDEAGAKAGQRLGIPTEILAPKRWKYRDASGTDISNEQAFKDRFSQKVSPQASNEAIGAKLTAASEIKRLTDEGFANPVLKPLVDWLSAKYGDIELRYDPNQGNIGSYNVLGNQKHITVNPEHNDIKSNIDLYDTIAHEMLHDPTHQLYKNDMIFRKQMNDFYKQLEKDIIGTTFYEENKDDLDRIFNDPNNHNTEEMISYAMTGTSVLRQWMNDNEFKPGTKYLKQFYQYIMDRLARFFDKFPNRITYLQALETLMHSSLGTPNTVIEELDIPFYEQLFEESNNVTDIVDKSLALSDEALGDVRSMSSFIASLDLDLGQSSYEYIQSLSKEEFYSLVNRSKNMDQKMQLYYDKHFKENMTFDEYKQKVSTYVYNNINSVVKRKTAAVNIDSGGVATVKYYDTTFKTKDGSLISPYHNLTMLDDMIPALNELFGTKFEITYLEEIADQSGFKPISGKAHKLYFELKNNELQDLYAKVGIIFPGTFADKDTLVGLVEVDDKGNILSEMDYSNIEPTDMNQVADALLTMYQNKIAELVKSGKVTEEYAQEIDDPTVASIMRLVIEDIKLGGKVVNGQLQSALFNPEYADTYDAIKIFKRPYAVTPKYIISQVASEVRQIVDQVVRDTYNNDINKSGIVIKNDKVYYRSVIFNDEAAEITVGDKTFSLLNEYSIPIFDGGTVYGLGGFDVVHRYLTGAVKQGALKFWGGNSLNGEFSNPFFLKTAGHGYSQQDNIIQWARDNNISLIIPASAVKVNRFNVENLLNLQDAGNIIEIPAENLYRLQEKDEASDLARGMQQTLTTNFMVYANKTFASADEKKEFWGLAKQFTDNLINRFIEKTTTLDKQGLLDYIKDIIQNPTNEYHKGLSQVLSNMLITYADERVAELSNEDKANKQLVEELLRDQRLSNAQLAEKVSGLFYHPYFSKLFEDYMHRTLKELLFYELPSSYSVLAPDLGWLAQTRIGLASDYALTLAKQSKEQEVSNTYFGQQVPKEDQVKGLENDIKELEKQSVTLDKEREGITSAQESAVKEGRADNAVELKKRQDEIIAELETIADKIDIADNQIKELNKELTQIRKVTDGFIADGKVVVNGNKQEVQDARDKTLYTWINKTTGRIQGDYVYYDSDSAKKRGLKLGDTLITGFVPSDSAQSVSGATLIGIMNKSISEINKLVGWSEYFQSQAGKDFDFDTALVMSYDKMFGNRLDFQKLADIFRNTKNNYPAYIKGIMEQVLFGKESDKKLSNSDIYNKEIRLKYMQALSSTVKAPQTYNPLYNQSILNKYKKGIGIPVNKRKMATFKSLVNFRTNFTFLDNVFNIDSNRKDIGKTHVYHLIETNAEVDKPNDDTALKYYLDPAREFDLENGTELVDITKEFSKKDEVTAAMVKAILPKYLKMFKQIDKMLFGYGIKLSTQNNLDSFGETRGLQESVKYMRIQARVNELLKTKEGKQTLYDYFDSIFNVKATPKAKEIMLKVAKQYIDNIQIDDMEASLPMYMIKNSDLTTLPNLKLEKNEYLGIEEKVARDIIERDLTVKQAVADAYAQNKEYADLIESTAKENGKSARFNKVLFLLTKTKEDLHILKGKVLRLINMYVETEGLVYPQSVTIGNKQFDSMNRFKKGLSVKVDEQIFGDIFNFILDINNLAIRKTSPPSAEMNVNGKIMKVTPENGRLKFEIKGITAYHNEINSLARKGDATGKAFKKYFSEAFGLKEGKNRAAISSIVDFSHTLDLIDRWKLIEELVISDIKSLPVEDKQLLLTSLLSYSSEANESLYTGKTAPSNDRYLTLLSLLKDDVTVNKFVQDYAVGFTNSVPHPGFGKAMDTINTLKNSDADWEVWHMQSPKKKDLQSNLVTMSTDEMKKSGKIYKKGTSTGYKTVDLLNGIITDLNTLDVDNIIKRYMPNTTTDKGDIESVLATIQKHNETVEHIGALYKEADIDITGLEKKLAESGNQMERNFLKAQEQSVLRNEIEELVTTNPDNISIKKNADESYTYVKDNIEYNSTKALLDSMGIIDIRNITKYEIALKWHSIYSVENPAIMKSMIDYLNSIVLDFGRNSYAIQAVLSMKQRYETSLKNIMTRQFHYYPRVYQQHIFDTKIMNYLKTQEAVRIQEEIAKTVNYIAQNNQKPERSRRIIPDAMIELASHDGDAAWILSEAKKNVENEKFNIGVGTFGKYVNGFSLKRNLPDTIDGIKYYMTDSMLPHFRHQTQMQKMLVNDLLLTNWFTFQHKALINKVDPEIIERVKTELATINGNRMLLNRDVQVDEILPGMELAFYHIDDKYYNGIVDRVDKTYVYLKMDKNKFEDYLRQRIIDWEATDLAIQSNPNLRGPSYKQLATLQEMASQGYISVEAILTIPTAYEASTRIITLLKAQINDRANWGRFKKADMFRKNPSATGGATGENGAYRYLEFGSLEHLKGMARELDNTYDGQLSQSGFGDILQSGQLLPYLKYEAFHLPGNLINTLSKTIAIMGLSTPGARVMNWYEGMAGVIRDRGAIKFFKTAGKVIAINRDVKSALESGNLTKIDPALRKTLSNTGEVAFEDKEKAAGEIAKRFLFERGLIFDDYLINSIGNIEDLFTQDEKNQVKYRTTERLFNLYKIIKDSMGYKAHRDKIIQLEKDLYDAIDPILAQSLMKQIAEENTSWDKVYSERMQKAAQLAQKYTAKNVSLDLMKINLAELHNKTTADLVPMMGKLIANFQLLGTPIFKELFGTHGFKKAEGHNRRMAAINYIWDALQRGETDVELIKLEAAKGIARTQALYDKLNRRLWDRTELGRFSLMFGQYPFYMEKTFKATIAQANDENRTDLKKKLAMEWYRDTVMSGFNFLLQGFRVGSPINVLINATFILLLNALQRWDDGEEPFDFSDWDTRDIIFTMLQFRIGMGIGIALGSLYNMATDQNKIFSIGRIGRVFDILGRFIFGSEEVQKFKSKNNDYQNKRFLDTAFKYGMSFDPLFPGYNKKFTDPDLVDHFKQPIEKRPLDYWKPFVPLLPHIQYGTNLNLKKALGL